MPECEKPHVQRGDSFFSCINSNIKLKIQTEICQKMVLTVYGEAVRLSAREMGKYGKHAVIY